jgi:hypothetical protein
VATLITLFPLHALAGDATTPTETVIRLTVEPMRAPRPALKYQLLPELSEINPGNPVLGYTICFAEQQNFFFSKEATANRERWLTMPLPQLAREVGKDYGGSALRQADWAARLDTPDWQILLKLKRDGIRTLLPDIQQLRLLATALKVRFRLQIAEKRFDDAIATAKTMFALGHHLGEHPTLIGNLVGIAIASITIDPLDEMLEQPDCPNLYWAFTDLPNPLVGLSKGLQGERSWLNAELAQLDDRAPMHDDALEKTFSKLHYTLGIVTDSRDPRSKVKEWVQERAADKDRLAAARRRLAESGLPAERLAQFPPAQVILLDEKVSYEADRDEGLRAMQLPYWQGAPLMPTATRDDLKHKLFGEFVPITNKVRRAQARLEQRISLLRHVEAVRMYAAEHDGKLPATLADVGVPLPVDPMTGKPFIYSVEADTAKFQGTPPAGETGYAFKVRYEVTIRKEK